jgi:hypothetical protein
MKSELPPLEEVALRSGVDLAELEALMSDIAEKEPGSLERMLLDSNAPREARLRVGLLVHELVVTKHRVHQLEAVLLSR